MKTRFCTALVAIVALFVLGACRAEEEQAEPPANQLGSFQLVGRVEAVRPGGAPDVEVEQGTPSPGGENTPTEPGMIEVTLQSSSAGLRERCGVDRGERVDVWWSTGTRFDPASALTDLEDALGGQRVSAQGRIFGTGATTSPPAASPATSPAAAATSSPAATAAVSSDCVLIADHVEISQGDGGGSETTARPTASVSPGIPATPSPTTSPGAPRQ